MRIELRVPTEDDILELLANLAEDDQREILALGVTPEWGVRRSIEDSTEVVAIFNEDQLACFTGLAVLDGLAPRVYPWLLGTTYMQRFPRTVGKLSKTILRRWRAAHPYMTNFVDARHTRAIAWLTWLGAEIDPPLPYGPFQRDFRQFHFGRQECA